MAEVLGYIFEDLPDDVDKRVADIIQKNHRYRSAVERIIEYRNKTNLGKEHIEESFSLLSFEDFAKAPCRKTGVAKRNYITKKMLY